MLEINIATVLVKKRREKGITQEELANYLGISKASVSKWETGLSYPDISFLPVLASYFDITIDELMDYKAQLSKEDIKKLYERLADDFSHKDAASVFEESRAWIKKYHSCYSLLLQMGILYVNHANLLNSQEAALEIIKEAKVFFVRVREESSEVTLVRKALYLEAFCELTLGNARMVVELLSDMIEDAMPPEILLASAYQMLGDIKKAKGTLQMGMYQNMVVQFNYMTSYLSTCSEEAFEETVIRAEKLSDAYDLGQLHPSILLGFYLTAAQGFMRIDQENKAIVLLQKYVMIAEKNGKEWKLHGDAYFDCLDEWIESFDLGSNLPRKEALIWNSLVEAVTKNPIFEPLKSNTDFIGMQKRLLALQERSR